MTVEIALTQGLVTIVDEVDADLAALRWYAQKGQNTFYARRHLPRREGKQSGERLHQAIARRMGILGAPDHKDRNGLNNCRDNLRPASKGQNNANVGLRSDNVSGFKGVNWDGRQGKWRAYIRPGGKQRFLGYFDDPVSAAKVHDRAAIATFGEFAFLNFPATRSL